MNPPEELDGARVLCFAPITASVTRTDNTLHWTGGQRMEVPYSLAICQYSGSKEFYLFYCDENWTVLSDTLHVDLDGAKRQAEFEYAGVSVLWAPPV